MNGYIKININGEPVGIKFGFSAITSFYVATEEKKEVYYSGESLTFLGIAKLIHCGYKNNCEIREEVPALTLEDFHNWVEEAMTNDERKKEVAEVLNVFSDSQYVKALIDLPKEETKKKTSKSTLKKSKVRS